MGVVRVTISKSVAIELYNAMAEGFKANNDVEVFMKTVVPKVNKILSDVATETADKLEAKIKKEH